MPSINDIKQLTHMFDDLKIPDEMRKKTETYTHAGAVFTADPVFYRFMIGLESDGSEAAEPGKQMKNLPKIEGKGPISGTPHDPDWIITHPFLIRWISRLNGERVETLEDVLNRYYMNLSFAADKLKLEGELHPDIITIITAFESIIEHTLNINLEEFESLAQVAIQELDLEKEVQRILKGSMKWSPDPQSNMSQLYIYAVPAALMKHTIAGLGGVPHFLIPGMGKAKAALNLFVTIFKFIGLELAKQTGKPNFASELAQLQEDKPIIDQDGVIHQLFSAAVDTTAGANGTTLLTISGYADLRQQVVAFLTERGINLSNISNSTQAFIDILKQNNIITFILKEILRVAPATPYMPMELHPNRLSDEQKEQLLDIYPGIKPLLEKGKPIPVQFNLMGMQSHPDYYTNPEIFDPMRWSKDGKNYNPNQYAAYFPFAIGEKMCVGRDLATMEIVAALSNWALLLSQMEAQGYVVGAQIDPINGLKGTNSPAPTSRIIAKAPEA